MPLGRLLVQVTTTLGSELFNKRALIAPALVGLTAAGKRVKSTDATNNMCIYANVNQELLKAEAWHDKKSTGYVRLNLSDNPRAHIFANSAGNMQGGIQASLHDLASCAAISAAARFGAHLAMNIQYLGPVPISGTNEVNVVAKIIGKTYGHVFLNSELYADKNLASIANHTIRAKPFEDSKKDGRDGSEG